MTSNLNISAREVYNRRLIAWKGIEFYRTVLLTRISDILLRGVVPGCDCYSAATHALAFHLLVLLGVCPFDVPWQRPMLVCPTL